MMGKVKHPGKTQVERGILDAIGCGDSCPPMTKRTREALLRKGLIEIVGHETLGTDQFGKIEIPIYQMPIPIHYKWCQAMSAESDEEEAMR